jgi:predicted deacylase
MSLLLKFYVCIKLTTGILILNAIMSNINWESETWIENGSEIHKITSINKGVRLLVLGSVHGNEKCGSTAIDKVLDEIKSGETQILTGSIAFISRCNPKANSLNRRFVDRDLNRDMRVRETTEEYEDQIANALIAVMGDYEVLLDLHSFRAEGPPFVFLGPNNNIGEVEPFSLSDKEERYAEHLGLSICVHGWLTAYDQFVKKQHLFLDNLCQRTVVSEKASLQLGVGVAENFRRLGGYGVTVECGNHNDQTAPDVAYSSIKNALGYLGIIDEKPKQKPFNKSLKISQVLLKLSEGDKFPCNWQLFDKIQQDDILVERENGELETASAPGAIIFIYSDALVGGAWLYIAKDDSKGLEIL